MNDKIFQEHFDYRCKDSGLTDTAGPIIVGFSGGSDSCVLLHMLNILLGEKRKIVAIHVNHNLRAIDSDKDAKHAKTLGVFPALARYGIVCWMSFEAQKHYKIACFP